MFKRVLVILAIMAIVYCIVRVNATMLLIVAAIAAAIYFATKRKKEK